MAIYTGVLVRKPCEKCGAPAQAHHDSYYPEKWLCVRWLCASHHSQWHAGNEPEWPTIYEFHPSDVPVKKRPGPRPKPWKRSSNGQWYVTLSGKQHSLGYDEAEAQGICKRLLVGR